MKSRNTAIVIFYTDDKKILLQSRKLIKKWGEEWSFWGGGVEAGETKEQAAKREIKEELNFNLRNIKYIGTLNEVVKQYRSPHEKIKVIYKIFTKKNKRRSFSV